MSPDRREPPAGRVGARQTRRGFLKLAGGAMAGAALAPWASGVSVALAAPTRALVLYDTTGPFGWLGELYAILATNLCSHFGARDARPVTTYTAGLMSAYSAVIYVGSTFDEPVPQAFLDDVLNLNIPVIWAYDNIWQLKARADASATNFVSRYGWQPTLFDNNVYNPPNGVQVNRVQYKGTTLTRFTQASVPFLMNVAITNGSLATSLATALRSDNSSLPWAVRAKNLTYLAENPFVFTSENDRGLIFSDLLFDALAPLTPIRHRALLRLEDIAPSYGDDPDQMANLIAVTQYLAQKGIPYGFGLIPRYRSPLGDGGYEPLTSFGLADLDTPQLVQVINNMRNQGGTMVLHGWTHQFDGYTATAGADDPLAYPPGFTASRHVFNPYSGATGDDAEFYFAYLDPPGLDATGYPAAPPTPSQVLTSAVRWQRPVDGDSNQFAAQRLSLAAADLQAAGLPMPTIFEFPHYFASVADYQAVAASFTTRYERAIYPSGLLRGGALDYSRIVGQFFPYVVTDHYGTKVLPENIGNYEQRPQNLNPPRFAFQVADNAAKNLVIRDGFASFFYHPFNGVAPLRAIIEGGRDPDTGVNFTGVLGLGYSFVSPASL